MDTRPGKVCCGIWHIHVSSRSFKSRKLQGGAFIDQTYLSSTPHRCSTGMRSREFGGQVNVSLCALNLSWTIFAVRQGALSCLERPLPLRDTVSMKGCSWLATIFGWYCIFQRKIHIHFHLFPIVHLVPTPPQVNDAHAPDVKEKVIHETRPPFSKWFSSMV